MAVKSDELHSTMTLSIQRAGTPVDGEFSYTPIQKRIPAGLWGEALTPDVNSNTFIENVPTGFEITPKKSHEPGETASIDIGNLQYATSYFPKDEGPRDRIRSAYAWEPDAAFVNAPNLAGREAVSKSIKNNDQRQSLLAALKVDVKVNVGEEVVPDFLSAPKIGTFSG